MLITFDCHPRQVLHADFVPQLLSTLDEKTRMLRNSGVDDIEILHFTPQMASLTAEQFMTDVLARQLQVETLVMGYDHRFGHGGGSYEDYVRWGRAAGIEVVLADEFDKVTVSSSRIRRSLLDGNIALANSLLGYTYSFEGIVVRGHQVGRTIGFPTANISVPKDKLIPASGVYAVRVTTQEGTGYKGMLCIGNRPTVQNGADVTIEVNLFDYTGDLYDCCLRIEVVERLRDEVKYESLEQLKVQLQRDAVMAQSVLNRV